MRLSRFARYVMASTAVVAGSLGLWAGCRTSPEGNDGLKDAVPDDGRFASTKLKMWADVDTGDVFVAFDAASAGLSEGERIELVWDVLQTRSDVNCSALRKRENVTIPESGKVELKFRVDPSSLKDFLAQGPVNDQQDKFDHLRGGDDFKGNTFVEGCLVKGGKPIAAAQSAPDTNVAQRLQGGLSLQEGDDLALPPHIRYAERCAQAIGYVEPVNCVTMGQAIPITVDGVAQTTTPASCDKPVYLEGPQRCGGYTRVGRLKLFKDKQRTQERDDGAAVFFCRHYDDASTRQASWDPTLNGASYPYFDDVAIIMQNRETGKTCYFQALGRSRDQALQLYGRRVPPPTETDEEFTAAISPEDRNQGATPSGRFWLQPSGIARIHCVSCHDNDPFMHSPWIDQARVLGANGQPTSELLVPSEPFNEYKIIGAGFGFERWDTSYSLDLPDNKCTTCHRIASMKTCRQWIQDAYPVHPPGQDAHLNDLYVPAARTALSRGHPDHHWMPPPPANPAQRTTWLNRLTQYESSIKEIRRCCELQNNGRRILGNGYINGAAGRTISQEDLDFLSANGCPVVKTSEVVER